MLINHSRLTEKWAMKPYTKNEWGNTCALRDRELGIVLFGFFSLNGRFFGFLPGFRGVLHGFCHIPVML
jgi:hypothetical protein